MRRIALVTLSAVFVLAVGGYAFYKLSPWPSVWVIRYAFAKGDEQAAAAAAPFVPKHGIRNFRDVAYDPKVSDAKLDVFTPDHAAGPVPAVVWVHGGGFVAGLREPVANYLQVLVPRGFAGVAVGYTRAPTVMWPGPVRQTNQALAYLVANAKRFNIDPNRIFLAGDSAGAHIAAQTALVISNPAYARLIGVKPGMARDGLRGVLLYCGPYNPNLLDLNSPWGRFSKTVTWAYLGTKNPADPRVQNLVVTTHVTADFPPVFISVGNADGLAPQSVELADALRAKGVEVDSLFFPRDHQSPLPHEYQRDLSTRDAQLAFNRALAFLETHSK